MHREMKWLSCFGTALAVLLAMPVAAQEYENPPIFGAEEVFHPELLSGPGYEVREAVQNNGFSNLYFVETPEGLFEIESRALLEIRIQEFRALEIMKEVSGSKEYASAVGEAAKGPFVFAKDMITSPIQTTGGVFSGIGSYFSNIGHGIFGSPSEEEEGVVKRILGFDATKRGYAQEFEVDPYSTNEPLQDRMKDLSWASFAGGMTTAVATAFIPGAAGTVVAVTSFSNDMNQLIYDNNPPKLKSINREKLEAMEVSEEVASVFLDHPQYTPTRKTFLVGALEQMEGVENREAMVDVSILAANADDAFFWQRQAEAAAAYHVGVEPVARFTRVGVDAVLQTADGRVISVWTNDYLAWTEEIAEGAAGIDGEQGADMVPGMTGKAMWFAGDVSPLAREKLEALEWTIEANKAQELKLP